MSCRADFAMPTMHSIHRGILTYERGFEVIDVSGWMQLEELAGEAWVIIFGDPDRPAWQQRYTAVRASRVIEVDVEEVIPLDESTDSVPRQREGLHRAPAA